MNTCLQSIYRNEIVNQSESFWMKMNTVELCFSRLIFKQNPKTSDVLFQKTRNSTRLNRLADSLVSNLATTRELWLMLHESCFRMVIIWNLKMTISWPDEHLIYVEWKSLRPYHHHLLRHWLWKFESLQNFAKFQSTEIS